MIRRSTLMTALCAMLLTGSAMAQVSVSTKLPATAVPGGSFTVELNVTKKTDVTGFAKMQQLLPTGFTATPVETANSTFSFKDRKVKFLWMALPNGDFTVSYKVSVDESLSGNQIIEGTFAYIKDNETEKFIIPKDIITIQADQAEAAQQAAMDEVLAAQQEREDAANAARDDASGTEEEVVEEVDNSAAEAAEAAAKEADRAQQAENEARAADEARRAEEQRKAEMAEKARAATEAAAEESRTAQASSYNDAMMKSKPGLVFRVQVAAGPNQVTPSFFEDKYGISESVVVDEHEGLFKYVVGEFGSYRPAKTFSNELRDSNGVEGPFVTAYNDGVRIHVKEALEIARQ